MRRNWIVRGLKIALFAAIVIAVFGESVLQLWNWLMPAIFGLHPIGFWQAIGLLALSWILFGGLRGHGYRGPWRRGMRERWEQMSPEQRGKFRQGLQSRCGSFGPPAEETKL